MLISLRLPVSHKGLAPHKITSMPGRHNAVNGSRECRGFCDYRSWRRSYRHRYAAEGDAVAKVVYEIDGRDFATLQEFYDVVSQVLIPGAEWGHNLNAFNDILRGGLGTPDGGFILRWVNSAVSRERLGHLETVRQLERLLAHCHPTNRAAVSVDLARARQGVGPTVFDWLIEIIEVHGAGGREQEDGVELVLA